MDLATEPLSLGTDIGHSGELGDIRAVTVELNEVDAGGTKSGTESPCEGGIVKLLVGERITFGVLLIAIDDSDAGPLSAAGIRQPDLDLNAVLKLGLLEIDIDLNKVGHQFVEHDAGRVVADERRLRIVGEKLDLGVIDPIGFDQVTNDI